MKIKKLNEFQNNQIYSKVNEKELDISTLLINLKNLEKLLLNNNNDKALEKLRQWIANLNLLNKTKKYNL